MNRYILIPLLCFALLAVGGAAAQASPSQAAPSAPEPATYLWGGASFRSVVHEGFLRTT